MIEILDAVTLARVQFAFTIMFHIIFPAFSIGLASYLLVLETLWLRSGKAVYLNLFRFWMKIFAVAFGMGVVSGIAMSYQFGTNWSVFSDRAGPVIGPLMTYEVLTAFFMEAGFLGVMLFGMGRVSKSLHVVATGIVAAGTLVSAFWILAVNSWMHTPAGYSINDASQFVPEDWFAIVFNPSFPFRLVHMVLAAYLTTALVVAGVGAFHLLRERTNAEARKMFSMAMWMVAFIAPLQVVAGDLHGLNTLRHQPVKVMAMEGHYESYPEGAPLFLFGLPDEADQRLDYALGIPRLGSLILHHDLDHPVKGLDTVPDEDQPPVAAVFFSFRIMVVIGLVIVLLGLSSLVLRRRQSLFESPAFLRTAVAMGPSGFVAIVAGWVTTEVGRQPYTVYGLLLTADSASPIDTPAVAASLTAFVIVYLVVFGCGIWYLLRMMRRGPAETEPRPSERHPKNLRSALLTQPLGDGAGHD
ncbi:MAG: cytochrome ubiquinol oxidase subunit I [Gammaproteobacteria bacterium]|nr:cytochrome ubiquinol oxidase subunit I [Gammaproteobacteria bacterium]MYJ74552.1 cytochrome ubiquinol oxidase subunit I [Gammaproteobacteria bacterium]